MARSNTIEITPHGFGALTMDELHQLASLLLKAGYTDIGITRNQPNKGRPYIYTVRARRSVTDRESKDADGES